MSLVANPMGLVPKDAAYSNLYGVRINGLNSVVNSSNYKLLDALSAEIKNVTASTINGSSVNIALTNCNPNELLATDAQTKFVSIPYTTDAIANSVPKRSATEFTSFAQLFLTDASNQITANVSPNQLIVNALTPVASRIYSLSLEGTSGARALTVTSSALSNTSFLDPATTITQLALKSAADGVAQLNVNSATGFNSYIKYNVSGGPLWLLGNVNTDDHFTFLDELDGIQFLAVDNLGANARFTSSADLTPPSGQIVDLGSPTQRFNSVGLSLGAGTTSDLVLFTGVVIASGAFRAIVVANPNVTTTPMSTILCQVEDFDGVYFTDGCPYALVTNIGVGSFELNVFNVDVTNAIGALLTVSVRYWVLP